MSCQNGSKKEGTYCFVQGDHIYKSKCSPGQNMPSTSSRNKEVLEEDR